MRNLFRGWMACPLGHVQNAPVCEAFGTEEGAECISGNITRIRRLLSPHWTVAELRFSLCCRSDKSHTFLPVDIYYEHKMQSPKKRGFNEQTFAVSHLLPKNIPAKK